MGVYVGFFTFFLIYTLNKKLTYTPCYVLVKNNNYNMKRIKKFNELNEHKDLDKYKKLLKKLNSLKYEDDSMVDVKLSKDDNNEVEGFKFYLTDVGLKFEEDIDRICKECGFDDWYQSGENSLTFQ